MTDDKKPDVPIELTILVLLGWVLPVVGYAWGPGAGWAYGLWVAVGTALIVLWLKLHPGVIDFTTKDDQQSP